MDESLERTVRNFTLKILFLALDLSQTILRIIYIVFFNINLLEQRNGSIVHDVTSFKYNQKNEVFLHTLTCFPRLNKRVYSETLNNEYIGRIYQMSS